MSGRSQASRTLYLVDGTYTVFRSYYAINRLTAPDGTPTNGVLGFLNTVRKLLRERQPDFFGVAFDVAGPTHRDELFAEYKANRGAPPDDLVPQFDLAEGAARALGWPVLICPGFEADDVLATLAESGRAQGVRVVLVTSDKDLYQLVGPDVVVLNPAKEDRILDPSGVLEIFGVRPDQVVDVLSLMGDAVDNVPGVPGIGEKTAKAMVSRYGDLDAVLERARLFHDLWEAKERALSAQEAGDRQRLNRAMEELVPLAEALAAWEERLGGEAGADLTARFRAAQCLTAGSGPKVIKKVLGELEKKTQPKAWLALHEHREEAEFSRRLVRVRTDAPVALDWEALKIERGDRSRAIELFRRLGFRQWSAELAEEEKAGQPKSTSPARETKGDAAPEPTPVSPEALAADQAPAVPQPPLADQLDVAILDEVPALLQALGQVRRAGRLAVDTETDRLDARNAKLVGVSLAWGPGGGAYIPVGHRTEERQLPWAEAHSELTGLLGDPAVPKIGQNLKFDRKVLRTAGLPLHGIAFDTLLAAQLLDPDRTRSHTLDTLAERFLGQRLVPYSELAGTGSDQRTLDQVLVGAVARYAVEDAVAAWQLAAKLQEELRRAGLWELFEQVEMPLLPILDDMEERGIRIDRGALAELSAFLERDLAALEQEIHQLAGRPFNVNSPVQLRQVLFDELKLSPVGRRTQKTKVQSTAQEVLEALAEVHPLPQKVLEYRERIKLKGTYVDTLPLLADADGRVHTQFHQLGAATGRLSSSDPNLQNIPVRTELGRRIRSAFVPAPGWKFLSADYSQMELRIMAHLSEDPGLLAAFSQGLDVHAFTAAQVTGMPLEQVTPAQRAAAKAVNFGILYGMSEYRLARDQGMSVEEARQFIAAYFARYPRVRGYIEETIRQVQQTGEVRTYFGRIRRFPELVGGETQRLSRPVREGLLRQAVNATIQGTGADIVKIAMVALERRLTERGLAARMVLQVHDELLFEAPPGELAELAPLVRETMEASAKLSVPLKVDLGMADDWARAH